MSQMEHAHMERTEELIEYSPEDCNWYKPGCGFTCEAKDIGVDAYVECLEKDSYGCQFSISYGYSRYCSCPARVYIAKNSKI
jgi:hypothetical protein